MSKGAVSMRRALLTAVALCCSTLPVHAGAEECNDAIEQYNSTLSDIEYALRRYSRCVSGSQGQDDCYSEFRRLKSAQDDFEAAVSDHGSECE
jgi:hypothetical protein